MIGRIPGFGAVISFHRETATALRADFERAVDDDVLSCKQRGITAEKTAFGKLMLRVAPEVHGKALVEAQAAGKSRNRWATEFLGAIQGASQALTASKHWRDGSCSAAVLPVIQAMHRPVRCGKSWLILA